MKFFQDIIFELQNFWKSNGCAVLQPLDLEIGAGTLHHATALKALGSKKWNVCYPQACRRPGDFRYTKNPNRFGHYYQFQVILKPVTPNIQELFLESLSVIGFDIKNNDVRFIEDNWENPSIGASGVGWEVCFNGMEITQFTYMQQIGGFNLEVMLGEIAYGLERIAMHLQDVDNILDIKWNEDITYKDLFLEREMDNSFYTKEYSDDRILFSHFKDAENQAQILIDNNLPVAAYEQALKASHILNLLDSKGVISSTERTGYILIVREIVKSSLKIIQGNHLNKMSKI